MECLAHFLSGWQGGGGLKSAHFADRTMEPAAPDSGAEPLTPSEWAALLPLARGPADPGAAAKAALPLGAPALSAALPPAWRPGFSVKWALSALMGWHGAVLLPCVSVLSAALAPAWAVGWLARSGLSPFPDSQLALYAVLVAVCDALYTVLLLRLFVQKSGVGWDIIVRVRDHIDGIYNFCVNICEPMLPAMSLAGVARWAVLCRDAKDGGEEGKARPSKLVAHDPSDRMCPCDGSGPQCGGAWSRKAAVSRLVLDVFLVFADVFAYCILPFWTFYVSQGAAFWTNPWTAATGAFLVAWGVCAIALGSMLSTDYRGGAVCAMGITRRLRLRAFRTALDSFLGQMEKALQIRDADGRASEATRHSIADVHEEPDLAGAAAGVPIKTAPCADSATGIDFSSETYVALVERFADEWDHDLSDEFLGLKVVFPGTSGLARSVLFVATGSCIPIWAWGAFAVELCHMAFMLATAAAANARIADVAVQLRHARSRLRSLLVRNPVAPAGARAAAADHAAFMAASAAQADAGGTRILGFAVREGSARAIVAAALTVAFGIWGVLRSVGVRLTLEIACEV
ncbi:hypothetical protein DFJ74DRAFT_419478 [Hyaloraphidium curvatum]|nr:hypothetical protein DFJ74DRAFT_419478 [Hyaloraphidium curvatum]